MLSTFSRHMKSNKYGNWTTHKSGRYFRKHWKSKQKLPKPIINRVNNFPINIDTIIKWKKNKNE